MSDALTGAARDAETVREALQEFAYRPGQPVFSRYENATAALARLLAAVEAAEESVRVAGGTSEGGGGGVSADARSRDATTPASGVPSDEAVMRDMLRHYRTQRCLDGDPDCFECRAEAAFERLVVSLRARAETAEWCADESARIAAEANEREKLTEARAETAERERDIAAAAVDYIEQQLFGDTNPVRLMDDVLARIDALAAAEARAVELEGALGDILSHEGHTSTEQCLALIFESVREALVAGVCPPELIGTDEGDRASTQSVTGAGVCPAPGIGYERLASCIEQWPDCRDGAYDPRCCRFPKQCSCYAGVCPADSSEDEQT